MDTKEDTSSTNMELRMITLDLMKIAVKKKKSFKQVAREYINNVITLKKMLERDILDLE